MSNNVVDHRNGENILDILIPTYGKNDFVKLWTKIKFLERKLEPGENWRPFITLA
jgi:hypothetical protein